MTKQLLSDRLRSEAACDRWVIAEVEKLEAALARIELAGYQNGGCAVIRNYFRSRYGNVTLPVKASDKLDVSFDGQVYLNGHRIMGVWFGRAGSRAPKRAQPRLGDLKLIKGKWHERRWHRTQIAPGVSALQVAWGRPVYEWVIVSET